MKISISLILIFIAINVCYYCFRIYKINKDYQQLYDIRAEIGLRKFPYPYKAALTIASDIDETINVDEFLEIQEFLNTKNITAMGKGVGLEIGNSFFMFVEPNNPHNFSYFTSGDNDKRILRDFISAGYIDSFHSWGDGYNNRSDAVSAVEEMERNHLKIKVWINHAKNKTNLGNYYPKICLGDNIDSKYYHADLTVPYGIKFVWDFNSTSIIGQATPIDFNTFIGNYDSRFALKSTFNIAKAFIKNIIAIYGLVENRYSLHATNDLVEVSTLNDGQKVYKFLRYDTHPDGIGAGTTSKTMSYNLSERVIGRLIDSKGYAILYAHFGKNLECEQAICEETIKSLRNLEKEFLNGNIYVTTTYKMLNYYINHKYLDWIYKKDKEHIDIIIKGVNDPIYGYVVPTIEDLRGITFYVPSGKKIRIFIQDHEIPYIEKNYPDESNRESVTIPLIYLKYPNI